MSSGQNVYGQDPDIEFRNKSLYIGTDAGIPVTTGSFSSLGYDKSGPNYILGTSIGIKFTSLLSAELSIQFGHSTLTARECCVASGYWLGNDGIRYMAPVAGMIGWNYSEIKSSVAILQYKAHISIDILKSLSVQHNEKWNLNTYPIISVVGTRPIIKSRLTTGNTIKSNNQNWHFGYGIGLSATRAINTRITIGIYSDITCLTGKSIDGLPADIHKSSLIWDTGIKFNWIVTTIPHF